MPEPKLGVELTSLRVPLAQALSVAAQAGLQAVEIDAQGDLSKQGFSRTGLREFRKRLDDLHLRVSVVSYRTQRSYSTIEDLEPRIAGTKAALELAYDLRAPVVVIPIGKIPPDGEETARRLLVDVLGDLGRHGNRVGAMLAIGTGGRPGGSGGRASGRILGGVGGRGPESRPADGLRACAFGGGVVCRAIDSARPCDGRPTRRPLGW